MKKRRRALVVLPLLWAGWPALAQPAGAQTPPRAGSVSIMRSAEVKAGMQGVAWTVFQGTEPEAVPVEIIGPWKNAWGPGQDVILAKLGGKAARTNVAGGMSGSPVYIEGKLIGAIALRISVFSPDAICGITPIEHMLEIDAMDQSRPAQSRHPQSASVVQGLDIPRDFLQMAGASPRLVPIETPLSLSGFHEETLRQFRPVFEQMGLAAVQGGAAGNAGPPVPAPGWEKALQPGEAIAGVLVSGDMNITGLGTVTYNDGKRVLGFGHSFFNLGPLSMPMSKGEVLMVLSSQFQPNKFANATEIVGALRQDRHSGILGELGAEAETIPVSLKVKTYGTNGGAPREKQFKYHVFSHPRWTPFLMMLTTFNTLQGINDGSADEATLRLRGKVKLEGAQDLDVQTMVASGDAPMPAPMQLAAWWSEKFNRLYGNLDPLPRLKEVDAVLEVIPEKRTLSVDSAWLDNSEVEAGSELSGLVFLRPWRGEPISRTFRVKLPAGLPAGEHRLLLSDSLMLNRTQMMAGAGRKMGLPQTVSLINQERPNNMLYISIVETRPTVYDNDKVLSGVPPSVLNVLQAGRTTRPLPATMETARVEERLPFDELVDGSVSLRFRVK
jgi:hypothetical protein